METIHNTPTIQKMSNTRARVRLALTVAGILTAIICLFTLLHEFRSPSNGATVSQVIETSKIVPADFSVEISNVSVGSGKWLFW